MTTQLHTPVRVSGNFYNIDKSTGNGRNSRTAYVQLKRDDLAQLSPFLLMTKALTRDTDLAQAGTRVFANLYIKTGSRMVRGFEREIFSNNPKDFGLEVNQTNVFEFLKALDREATVSTENGIEKTFKYTVEEEELSDDFRERTAAFVKHMISLLPEDAVLRLNISLNGTYFAISTADYSDPGVSVFDNANPRFTAVADVKDWNYGSLTDGSKTYVLKSDIPFDVTITRRGSNENRPAYNVLTLATDKVMDDVFEARGAGGGSVDPFAQGHVSTAQDLADDDDEEAFAF